MLVQPLTPAARLAGAAAVLLDFDGPICSVFAGLPAAGVAARLRENLRLEGVALPGEPARTDDPHGLLAGLAEALSKQGEPAERVRALAGRVDGWLGEAEWEAVASATETPGAWGALAAFAASRRAVAVVSNNATVAIEHYLRRRKPVAELLEQRVFGRPSDPALMKPDRFLLDRALDALGGSGRDAVLVGDAVTDAEAAARAGVDFIGFAGGSERRRKRLVAAGVADTDVVDSWSQLR